MAETATVTEAIEASLNYLVPSDEKPFVYTQDPPPGMPKRRGEFEKRIVTIRDGRPIAGELSLDRQGFALQRRPTAVKDFYDAEEVERVYYPEIERLVKEVTGASKVVIFDHTVRNTAPEVQVERRVREPAATVHNDYTEKSAPQRVRDVLPTEEAEARLKKRYVQMNIWRQIAATPVQSWPLGLCDARSAEPRDLVASERRYPDRVGEIYHVTYNPKHRWYYFPRMRRDEVVLIKCFDSAKDGRARLSFHTAFEDPNTRPDAPPRESIEVRTLAFFD